MNYIGLSCGFHDAAMSIVDSVGNILHAGHSERYSKQKHDRHLSGELIRDALSYTVDNNNVLHYYERPYRKYLRSILSGERFPISNLLSRSFIDPLHYILLGASSPKCWDHHLSHAAAGFQTSPYGEATVVVIDAIGELDSASIWSARYVDGRAVYKRLWTLRYPHSIGLFYSAMTARVGLRPLDEEYILMGMAAWGDDSAYDELYEYVVEHDLNQKHNFHLGVDDALLSQYTDVQIAHATQKLAELLISRVLSRAADYNISTNLVYGGGVALNCTANRLLGNYFKNIWIMPNPGDAGSSLGAAALGYGRRLNWVSPYLGHNIGGEYPVDNIVNTLLDTDICGVANGRAEWGPRALGNRSLLADPRGVHIKDRVNEIKRRQKFRPFAPVILEEYVHQYFDMPPGWDTSPYMQVVAKSKYPLEYPAIIHIDGTSRVQTVPKNGSGIRALLEEWHKRTGCPMLLNTSLNIRGEPMVNDLDDARRFEVLYGVPVHT